MQPPEPNKYRLAGRASDWSLNLPDVLTTTHPLLLLAIVGLVLVTLLLLAWMVLRTKDAGMRFSFLGLTLDIFRGRRERETEPPEDEAPR